MKIDGTPRIVIENNILSGYYHQVTNKGVRARLFEFSSPSHPISQFRAPYDAILPNRSTSGAPLTGVAHRIKNSGDPISSDRSGKLYYYDNSDLYGVCHGYGRDWLTYYSGANFYNVFYPAGYMTPPFGENLSIFGANQEGTENLKMGACASLSLTEYNEQMGILSAGSSDVAIMTESLTPSKYSPIYSVRGVCPSDTAVETYYEEINLMRIPGTSSQLGATTFYNSNPIPTSLDSYRIVFEPTQGRYVVTGEDENRSISFGPDFRPLASYVPSDQQNMLNNILCPASLMETDIVIGKGDNGVQLIEAVDIMHSRPQDQVFVQQGGDIAFYYWHFTFKENADTLPFSNAEIFNPEGKVGVYHRGLTEDTMLFNPVLSYDESYWQNRQCPDTVDYLPWTFGASVYACPSYHFDVPYYAATKKFGFFGTRFLNSCSKLELTHPWNGVPNALEIPSGTSYPLEENEIEPHVDTEGSWTFSAYDNLLRTAKTEERYANMYALNKGFFLWANQEHITGSDEYIKLTGYNPLVNDYFKEMVGKFTWIFGSGVSGFLSGEPKVIMSGGMASTYQIKDSGVVSDILFTNLPYEHFHSHIDALNLGTGITNWNDIESKYAYFVALSGGELHEGFYSGVLSGREKRMRTRYMENTVRGNAVDLYPMNHIPFAFDYAKDYLEHTGWARSPYGVGGSVIPEIPRRYFEGAYGQASAITGLNEALAKIQFNTGTAYYPGFFNSIYFNKELPTPVYQPVLSGDIRDAQNRKFSPSGWLALGYNGIGGLDANFSCFTPLFIQHPFRKVYCKIGQHPTFHSRAVDYHSIPDDKISYRYPEIAYWAYRLKLVDSTMKNLYPLKYKWLRVPKTGYDAFLASGNFGLAEYASATGEWGCVEGDSYNCTFCHPSGSYPSGQLGDVANYTFLKGVQMGIDDEYYYMSMASGRFGIRLSEPSELNVENWLRFDVSIKNGLNKSVGNAKIEFHINDVSGKDWTITASAANHQAYKGYQKDKWAIPESVIEMKRPPPNAGFGDCWAYRFVGPVHYVGASRSWAPDTLKDTRGLRNTWGHFLEYGALTPFVRKLNQQAGDLLYGYKHLPTCDGYQMPNGKHGITVTASIDGYRLTHWTLPQQAVASMDSTAGMTWSKMGNLGQLYPPITYPYVKADKNNTITWASPGSDPTMGGYGVGHWQWGNNLGAIKRFGYFSTEETNDLVFIGNNAPSSGPNYVKEMGKVKEKFITPTTLAGENCGFHMYGLGSNMVYYIEAFGRFYLLCDLLKKKNVKNLSFMCPGLRQTNSAIQYFWLGQPNNVYLERRPMYGPYAYQWRVRRHNRDRNGNGISEGFYSMGWDSRYSLLYDAPAVYGLYVKKKASQSYQVRANNVTAMRKERFPNGIDYATFRSAWFGVQGTEGTSRPYGNFTCNSAVGGAMCDYIDAAVSLGETPDFEAYSCSFKQLKAGTCFDPCISMRYGQGFFPGGKKQDLFGNQETKTRLVPMANFKSGTRGLMWEEQSKVEADTFFRSPTYTPHRMIWSGLSTEGISPIRIEQIAGISPCEDGGSDHCNYLTPTIHMNTSSIPITSGSAFCAGGSFAMNLYEQYNIRGDIS